MKLAIKIVRLKESEEPLQNCVDSLDIYWHVREKRIVAPFEAELYLSRILG
jgi:hypothetical protein